MFYGLTRDVKAACMYVCISTCTTVIVDDCRRVESLYTSLVSLQYECLLSTVCASVCRLLCNTLQHTATHCNTLPHAATHCNTLQHTATHCNSVCECVQVTAALPAFERCILLLCRLCEAKGDEVHTRGGGLGSSTIFKKFHEPYAPS